MTGNSLFDRTGRIVALTLVALLVGGAVLLPAAVATVGDGPHADSHTSLAISASATEGAPGGETTIWITLENAGDNRSVSPVIALDSLPEGWSVVNATGEGAAFRQSTNEWLWVSLASGATVDATATLSIPSDAQGTYTIPIAVEDADGTTAQTSVTVALAGGSGGIAGLVTNPLVLAGFAAVALGGGWWYRSRMPGK